VGCRILTSIFYIMCKVHRPFIVIVFVSLRDIQFLIFDFIFIIQWYIFLFLCVTTTFCFVCFFYVYNIHLLIFEVEITHIFDPRNSTVISSSATQLAYIAASFIGKPPRVNYSIGLKNSKLGVTVGANYVDNH